jgi:hypothetical protein
MEATQWALDGPQKTLRRTVIIYQGKVLAVTSFFPVPILNPILKPNYSSVSYVCLMIFCPCAIWQVEILPLLLDQI